MAAAWKKQQEEIAQRERERAEAERIAKESKLSALGLANSTGLEKEVSTPPTPTRLSAGTSGGGKNSSPTPPPVLTRSSTDLSGGSSPPPKPAKPLPSPAAPLRPSKSAPRPPPKSHSSSPSLGGSIPPPIPAKQMTISGVTMSVHAPVKRNDSVRAPSSGGSSGGLLSSLSNTFTTMKAKTSEVISDVKSLSPFGSNTDSPDNEAEAPRPAMVISSPTRATHVGHLGYDAQTKSFEARNLPPEWQSMFGNLNRTLQEMGAEGLTAQEASYLLTKIELAPASSAPPLPPPNAPVKTTSSPTLPRPVSAKPPDEAPPRPPSNAPLRPSTQAPTISTYTAPVRSGAASAISASRTALELEESREETRKLRERLRTLEAEVRPLRGAEAELRQVRLELTDTRSRLERSQQRVSELERRDKVLELAPKPSTVPVRQSVMAGNGMREVYAKELQQLQDRMDEEREQLRAQIKKALTRDLESAQRATADSTVMSLKAELQSAKAEAAEVQSLRTARSSLQSDLDRVQAERQHLEDEIEQLRSAENKGTDAEAHLSDLRGQLKRAQEEASRHSFRVRALEGETSELRAQMNKMAPSSALQELQRDLSARSEQFAAERAALQEQVQREQKATSTIRDEVRQKDLQLAELREVQSQLKQQLESVQGQTAEPEGIKELEASIVQLRTTLQQEEREWSKRFDTIQKEKSAAESALSDARAQLAAASSSLDAEQRDAESQISQLTQELAQVKTQLTQALAAVQNAAMVEPMPRSAPPTSVAGPPPPPPPPTGGPPPPPPPPGSGGMPKPSRPAPMSSGGDSPAPVPKPAPSAGADGLSTSLLDSIRNPGIKLKKVSEEEGTKITVDKINDQSMLSVLAKALIDRRANMKEDHPADAQADEAWDD